MKNRKEETILTEEELMNIEGGIDPFTAIVGGATLFNIGRTIGKDLRRKFK